MSGTCSRRLKSAYLTRLFLSSNRLRSSASSWHGGNRSASTAQPFHLPKWTWRCGGAFDRPRQSHIPGASQVEYLAERGPLHQRGGQRTARQVGRFRRELSQYATATFTLAGQDRAPLNASPSHDPIDPCAAGLNTTFLWQGRLRAPFRYRRDQPKASDDAEPGSELIKSFSSTEAAVSNSPRAALSVLAFSRATSWAR